MNIYSSSYFPVSLRLQPGPNLHTLLVRRSLDAPHLLCWIIFRQGPEISSTAAVTGRIRLPFLVQEEVALMQTLSKLDAEMGDRLIYHRGGELTDITLPVVEEQFVHDLEFVLQGGDPVRQ